MKKVACVTAALLITLLSGCEEDREGGPLVTNNEIHYDPQFVTRMKPATAITQFAVSGARQYQDYATGNRMTNVFHVDDPLDTYTFIVFDEDGVLPGTRFEYELQVIDASLRVIWADQIAIEVPANYGRRVTRFVFVYSGAPDRSPQYSGDQMRQERNYAPTAANPTGAVGGGYQVTTPNATGRYVKFDLKFDLTDRFLMGGIGPLVEKAPP